MVREHRNEFERQPSTVIADLEGELREIESKRRELAARDRDLKIREDDIKVTLTRVARTVERATARRESQSARRARPAKLSANDRAIVDYLGTVSSPARPVEIAAAIGTDGNIGVNLQRLRQWGDIEKVGYGRYVLAGEVAR